MLKSVSFLHDSIPIVPSNLMASLEKVNLAIDSIGYPDAGYQVWEVNSDDSLEFRIIVEGSWPDQKTYDVIHDHELYKKAMEAERTKWEGLKRTMYHRFTKIK